MAPLFALASCLLTPTVTTMAQSYWAVQQHLNVCLTEDLF